MRAPSLSITPGLVRVGHHLIIACVAALSISSASVFSGEIQLCVRRVQSMLAFVSCQLLRPNALVAYRTRPAPRPYAGRAIPLARRPPPRPRKYVPQPRTAAASRQPRTRTPSRRWVAVPASQHRRQCWGGRRVSCPRRCMLCGERSRQAASRGMMGRAALDFRCHPHTSQAAFPARPIVSPHSCIALLAVICRAHHGDLERFHDRGGREGRVRKPGPRRWQGAAAAAVAVEWAVERFGVERVVKRCALAESSPV